MCELFAMSSEVPTEVRFLLDALARRGGWEAEHRDGWGVAFCEAGDALVLREPAAACESALVRFMENHGPRCRFVASHIRRRTQGSCGLADTHPFARAFGGKMHVFAHNGDLAGIRDRPAFAVGRHHPIGASDSEIAFGALLHRMEAVWPDARLPSPAARAAVVIRFARELAEIGPANFLYCDGDVMYAHSDRRRQPNGAIAPPGLHLVERRCDESFGHRPTSGVVVNPQAAGERAAEQRVVVLASVPLTAHEAWRPLPAGTLLIVRHGQVVAERHREGPA